MWQERIQRYILPGDIEKDPGFRREVERLSRIGLWMIGGIELAVSAFIAFVHILLDPSREMLPIRAEMLALLLAIGGGTLLAARSQRLLQHARTLATISALLVVGVITFALLLLTQFDPTANAAIPGNITLIMLASAAAIPFRPTDMLVFGFLVESIYVGLALAMHHMANVGPGVDAIFVLYIFMLTCLAAVLTAVVYEHRRSTYEWHLRTVEASERLRAAEARNLLSENAASVGRIAAALSHELNSPIGALISGVDTLLLLAARQPHSSPSEQQRLLLLQNDLRRSIQQSTDRLKEIVARMQRFSNLDKAEVQTANVNDLIHDVAALLEPRYKGTVQVDIDLQPVPPLVCRPQQISAVFSNLMGNAIDATDENGTIRIWSRENGSSVEVAFEDSGRGLSKEELNSIFDPGFKVVRGRVSTGNWSMFSSRQIVHEHGGDIHIESEGGKGTRVRVVLPVQREAFG